MIPRAINRQITAEFNAMSIKSKLILGAALISLAACGGGDADDAAGTGADTTTVAVLSPADVAVARRENIAATVIVSGTLNPYRIVEVRAQVPGVLSSLSVDRGSAVRAGQPLARIEAEGIRGQAAGARAMVAAAQAQVALARRQLESAKKLYDAGAMSEIEYQQATAAYESADAQLAAARAQAATAGESASRATVVAPISGVVSARSASAGEAVNPGQALLTIVDSRILELAGQVPVNQAAQIRPGMPVEFTLDAFPGRTLAGKVARVEPTADPNTRNIGVYVQVANTDRTLVGGLYATGRIQVGGTAEATVVPTAAIRSDAGQSYVWVIENGRVARRAVVLGERDPAGGVVQVLEGLSGGEQVIAAPGAVTEGMPVRIEAAAAAREGA